MTHQNPESRSVDSVGSRARRLTTAQLYLCVDSRRDQGDLEQFLDAALAGGVDIVQLRDKSIEAREELELLELFAAAAARHGALHAVNDRADIARLSGAPVLHLGQDDLPVPAARSLLGDDAILGLSTHRPEETAAAVDQPGLDYFCTGPVWSTPTKPGRAAVGLELVRFAHEESARRQSSRPWFAIGGIDHSTIGQVRDAGAQRVVVVRAITDASNPTDAAQKLRAELGPLDAEAQPTLG
ncbi:thiamine phosphate synthase [Saxibacter everestensis]|uniref:Thiamine-phosphate synthase n=1 Tax=Saxibacter everestensis TaxID=2909229 RepID=A0ABY8QN78_9MICO|nr:thiamine phosphate synthase [Brevibacteriaceae bacterium ZFBP1038]